MSMRINQIISEFIVQLPTIFWNIIASIGSEGIWIMRVVEVNDCDWVFLVVFFACLAPPSMSTRLSWNPFFNHGMLCWSLLRSFGPEGICLFGVVKVDGLEFVLESLLARLQLDQLSSLTSTISIAHGQLQCHREPSSQCQCLHWQNPSRLSQYQGFHSTKGQIPYSDLDRPFTVSRSSSPIISIPLLDAWSSTQKSTCAFSDSSWGPFVRSRDWFWWDSGRLMRATSNPMGQCQPHPHIESQSNFGIGNR